MYLNNSPEFGNLLGGNPLTKQRSSTGNKILIREMKKPNSQSLRRQVKNVMIGYYGYYTANSKPQMPVSAYSVGLNKAENNIE